MIVWERATGKPIHPAIVWQDRRTAAQCEALEQSGAGETVSAKTGLVLDPYFSATKLKWILDHVGGAQAQADRGELAFGTVDSWLIWHLTSGQKHVTDVTNASRTLLFNVVKGEWDPELLQLFGIPESMLPEVVWSSERVGEVTTALGRRRRGDCGHCRRPAGGALRTVVLAGGRGQKHLRNRLLPAAERRRGVHALAAPADYHGGGERGEAPRVRAGGLHLYRRRGGAVAPRQSEADRRVGRGGGAGRAACRTQAEWCLCRRSWAWALRTGTRTRRAC